jgi:hypothetical protein
MKHLLLLFFCALSVIGFSQKEWLPLDTVIKNCPVIVEGRVVAITPSYWNAQVEGSRMHSIFTSYIIKVYTVFKGDLMGKYLEVPIMGGVVDSFAMGVSDGVTMPSKDERGLFFLSVMKEAEAKLFYNSGDTLTKHSIMDAYYDPINYDANYTRLPMYLQDKEKNLFQLIERITGVKRKDITYP